jgi:pseudouridine kinase
MTTAENHVLVIGAAGIDVKARPFIALRPGADNLGIVRSSVGGVARNIAENLGRLEVPTVLISAVGADEPGKRIIRQTRRHGVDCRYLRRMPDETTAHHIAVLTPDADLDHAVSDFNIVRHINTDYLRKCERAFVGARLVVIDANLSDDTLSTVFALAAKHRVPVCADPTSPTLATRLCPYLDQLYLMTPNAAETSAICGVEHRAYDRDSAIDVARTLVTLGVEIAVVTLGEAGLAYADSNGGGYINALNTQVVDTTGAGDAFTGAMIFGLMNDVPIDEAMRLGITAASLTLQTTETVVPNLSQELLYSHLVV